MYVCGGGERGGCLGGRDGMCVCVGVKESNESIKNRYFSAMLSI